MKKLVLLLLLAACSKPTVPVAPSIPTLIFLIEPLCSYSPSFVIDVHNQRSGFHSVFLKYICDGPAHVRDLVQLRGIDPGQVLRVAAHGAGGLLVGPDPERVPARDRQQVGVLGEQRGDLVVGAHDTDYPGRPAAAGAAG